MSTYEIARLVVQAITAMAIIATLGVYYFQLRTMQMQLTSSRDASVAQNILAVVNFLQTEDVRVARTIVRQEMRAILMQEWDDQ